MCGNHSFLSGMSQANFCSPCVTTAGTGPVSHPRFTPTHLECDHIRPLCLLRQGLEEVTPHMGQATTELRLPAGVQGGEQDQAAAENIWR
jgi:hypothetical protein